jgi:hypothetical protein
MYYCRIVVVGYFIVEISRVVRMGTEKQRAKETFQWVVQSRRQCSMTDRLHKPAVWISKIFCPQKGHLVRDRQVESAIERIEEPRLEDTRGDPTGKGDQTYGLYSTMLFFLVDAVAVAAVAVAVDAVAVAVDAVAVAVAVSVAVVAVAVAVAVSVDTQPSALYYNIVLLVLIVYYSYVTPYCCRISSSSESRFSSSVPIGMQLNTVIVNVNVR